jgi:1-deoxy-D-xylulose-5-phosphate synthase
VTMEEGVINGSMGEKIKAYIKDKNYDTDVLNIALPDGYVEHGDVSLLRKKLEIDSDSVLKKVLDRYEKIKDEG